MTRIVVFYIDIHIHLHFPTRLGSKEEAWSPRTGEKEKQLMFLKAFANNFWNVPME